MTFRAKAVAVSELPEKLDRNSESTLLRELKLAMKGERPALVLDCSRMRQMDANAIHLLLCCLEEAMKRNGDVRLAALSEQAEESLRAFGVDRLFHIFDTCEQAVHSYQRRGAFIAPSHAMQPAANVPAESAA